LESTSDMKDKLTKLIDENRASIREVQTWSEDYVETSKEKFDSINTCENELEEKVQSIYTKLERDEFTDLNDMINEPKVE